MHQPTSEPINQSLNVISLFTGYGGMELGLRLWAAKHQISTRSILYVEWEKYAQEIIKARIRDGWMDNAPIWAGDIRKLDCTKFRGMDNLIVLAGFPCQSHSFAGLRSIAKGNTEDERNLWPDTLRTISEVHPRWVLLENVAGITSGSKQHGTDAYSTTVISQLVTEMHQVGATDIKVKWRILGADDVRPIPAPHRRKRWLLIAELAYPCNTGLEGDAGNNLQDRERSMGEGEQHDRATVRGTAGWSSDQLAESECKRYATTEQQGRSRYEEGSPQRSSDQLANTQCNSERTAHGKGVPQQPDIQQDNGNEFRDDTGNSESTLDDPTRGRFLECESIGQKAAHALETNPSDSGELGNTIDSGDRASGFQGEPNGEREKEAQEGQDQSLPGVSRPVDNGSGELANSTNERLQGKHSELRDTEGRQEQNGSPGFQGRTLPVWPPGPNQRDEWEWIIRERPDLAPAITKEAEHQFRLLVDGRSHRVGELKSLGNGVVPPMVAQFLEESIDFS